jgi:hypothetical protein
MPTLSSAPSSAAPMAAFDTTIHRRKTRPVPVGDVTIGGGYPVVVQSMINEDTLDIEGSVPQPFADSTRWAARLSGSPCPAWPTPRLWRHS